MPCTCFPIRAGNDQVGLNWNISCEEHGTESEWYNSPAQTRKREKHHDRIVELQRIAKLRRDGSIDREEALRRKNKIIKETREDLLE